MINIDESKLNKLEKDIHRKVEEIISTNKNITITKMAELCDCSVSKISKYVKKLGFDNYKQFIAFVSGNDLPVKKYSSELERIISFINSFDYGLVDKFIDSIDKSDKIILFGYGPSFICAQYFEYKLRIATNKSVIAVPDEISAEKLMTDNSLLIIFSVSGKFKSFRNLTNHAKKKKSNLLLLAEEYNTELYTDFDNILFLTNEFQQESLMHHEKTRTIFFIFIEEVILRIINKK